MSMELDGAGKKNPSIRSAIIIQWLLYLTGLLCKETIMNASNSIADRPPECMETVLAQLSTGSV
jgi:hypothetical protein